MRRLETLHTAAENDILSADRQRSITCCFPRRRDCSSGACCYGCQTDVGTYQKEVIQTLSFYSDREGKRASIVAEKATRVEHPEAQLSKILKVHRIMETELSTSANATRRCYMYSI